MRVPLLATNVAFPELPLANTQNFTMTGLLDGLYYHIVLSPPFASLCEPLRESLLSNREPHPMNFAYTASVP